MVSFNILGVCTTRDIFAVTKGDKKFEIKKYTLGFSPLFALEDGLKIDKEAFNSVETSLTPFRRRAAYLEFTHTVFDFLAEAKSDYLVIDLAVLKNSYLLTEDGHYFVAGKYNRSLYKKLVEELNVPAIKQESVPCDFLPKDEVKKKLKDYATKLLTIYKPEQIILCDHQHSRLCVKGKKIGQFKHFENKWGRRCEFISFCFDIMKNELKGCHVINYLPNAVANLNHRFGVSPLHFAKHYYSYCFECIEIILEKLPAEEEQQKLKKILNKWNKYCAVKYFPMLKKLVLFQQENIEKVDWKSINERKMLDDGNSDPDDE